MKNDSLFEKIQEVIDNVVLLEEDSSVKFELLQYLKLCVDSYPDEVVNIIYNLLNKTKTDQSEFPVLSFSDYPARTVLP